MLNICTLFLMLWLLLIRHSSKNFIPSLIPGTNLLPSILTLWANFLPLSTPRPADRLLTSQKSYVLLSLCSTVNLKVLPDGPKNSGATAFLPYSLAVLLTVFLHSVLISTLSTVSGCVILSLKNQATKTCSLPIKMKNLLQNPARIKNFPTGIPELLRKWLIMP